MKNPWIGRLVVGSIGVIVGSTMQGSSAPSIAPVIQVVHQVLTPPKGATPLPPIHTDMMKHTRQYPNGQRFVF